MFANALLFLILLEMQNALWKRACGLVSGAWRSNARRWRSNAGAWRNRQTGGGCEAAVPPGLKFAYFRGYLQHHAARPARARGEVRLQTPPAGRTSARQSARMAKLLCKTRPAKRKHAPVAKPVCKRGCAENTPRAWRSTFATRPWRSHFAKIANRPRIFPTFDKAGDGVGQGAGMEA